jgi:hypothetical protein
MKDRFKNGQRLKPITGRKEEAPPAAVEKFRDLLHKNS